MEMSRELDELSERLEESGGATTAQVWKQRENTLMLEAT